MMTLKMVLVKVPLPHEVMVPLMILKMMNMRLSVTRVKSHDGEGSTRRYADT